MNARINAAIYTWNRLEDFWKKSNCPMKFRLEVYVAIIRSKILYALESTALNQSARKKLNASQMKGIRRILGIPPTSIDRTKTNAYVLREANIIAYKCDTYEQVLEHVEAFPGAKLTVRTFTEFLDEQAMKHM
eukprot:11171863-Karenia_brevis.AAC.1